MKWHSIPCCENGLSFMPRQGSFLIYFFAGDTGVGKTTAARILCANTGDTQEYNCAQDNSKAEMLKIAKSTTSVSLWGGKRNLIMDEFHNIPPAAQTSFLIKG